LIEEKGCIKILVAIDGSEESMRAADYAILLASKYRARLIALHVIDLAKPNLANDTSIFIASTIFPLAELEAERKEARHWLSNIDNLAKARHIRFESKIIEDVVPRIGGTIVSYGEKEKVDLIVVGTRGRSAFKKVLIGSVASDVLHYAHCPVMIVK
jgi:nucleotide-binding universal stress UspA family protein